MSAFRRGPALGVYLSPRLFFPSKCGMGLSTSPTPDPVGSVLPSRELKRLLPDHLISDLRSMEEVLSQRAAAANRRLELPVLVTALAVFPMLLIELVATDGWLSVLAVVLNWLIWTVFAIEVSVVTSLTDNRLAYLRKAWLHLAVIVFAFPLLLEISANAGLTGTLRILRLVVLVAIFTRSCLALYNLFKHLLFDFLAVTRHPWMFVIRPLLKRRGLGLVTVAFFSLAVVAGVLHALFEGHHPGEGLWWALVTLTTVGYGDFAPVTAAGRLTAAVLMLSGIGVLAFVTASIAAYFVEGDYKTELHEEVRSINQRLDRIEELLSSQVPTDRDD